MPPEDIELQRRWRISHRLGKGGFGAVYAAEGEDGMAAAAKFVPLAPGVDRELLMVDLNGYPQVVPVVDHGEVDGHLVLVMPRAEQSLRDYLLKSNGAVPVGEAVGVLADIAEALAALDGRVVHRDLKPENVLLYNGSWCLTDFGIARYIDATTATATRSAYLSAHYAAPERWRNERSMGAADVYSLGVMAFELLAGYPPFDGSDEDVRESHLHAPVPPLPDVPPRLALLVEECLAKSPQNRPPATALPARLRDSGEPPQEEGLGTLAAANATHTRAALAAEAERQQHQSQAEQRCLLTEDASRRFDMVVDRLVAAFVQVAPSVSVEQRARTRILRLGRAQLVIEGAEPFDGQWPGSLTPVFDVAAHGYISVYDLHARDGGAPYYGRSHSLWFGDVQQAGVYGWFETAFMFSPLRPEQFRRAAPFALNPSIEEAAQAVWSGMATVQVAWPFQELHSQSEDVFQQRWAEWFAEASEGRLSRPTRMPEHSPQGSWRTE